MGRNYNTFLNATEDLYVEKSQSEQTELTIYPIS